MQSREEELSKLYEVLDRENMEEKVEDRYIESVRRRLSREGVATSHISVISHPVMKGLPKPKVKIFGGTEKKIKKEEKETKAKEEKREEVEVEDLFEVEKLSKEELEKILEREKEEIAKIKAKREEISREEIPIPKPVEEEKILPKEKFIELVSKIKGIGKKRAEILYESGYNSFEKIMRSEAKELAEKVKGLSEEAAERLKKEVSEILPKMAEEFDQIYLLKESKEEGRKVEEVISKSEVEFKEELPEWVTIEKAPIDEEPVEWKEIEKGEPYRYEDYTLYKVEKRGKIRYVFSKKPVKGGKPCQIPKGYIVRVNKKGKPSLEKVK